jgi:peptidoglycan/LPS O-acetylase OafA/YrhL
MGNLKTDKFHFHTFDALRFFAFLKVFLLHLPYSGSNWFSFIKRGGGIGVVFFFVLSGFLITWGILNEKAVKQAFSFKRFYISRFLRIAPLYYVAVLFAFISPWLLGILHLSFSNEGYEPDWRFSFAFLENLKSMLENSSPNVSPLGVMWSLCVEVHFYLIWALAMGLSSSKNALRIILCCFPIAFLFRFIYIDNQIFTNDLFTNIDFFAAGGGVAWLWVNKNEIISQWADSLSVAKRWLIVAGVILVVVCVVPIKFQSAVLQAITPGLYGLCFALLLAVFLNRQHWGISSRNPLSWLGRISYGMYVMHTVFILMCAKLTAMCFQNLSPLAEVCIIGIGSFGLTVLFSALSYRYFEQPVLKLREKIK